MPEPKHESNEDGWLPLDDEMRALQNRGLEAKEEVQSWPGEVQQFLREKARTADDIVTRHIAKAFVITDLKFPGPSPETLDQLVEFARQYELADAFKALQQEDFWRFFRLIVPPLKELSGRTADVAREFIVGFVQGGRATHAWFDGGKHDRVFWDFIRKLPKVRWSRAGDDFWNGVLTALSSGIVQTLALVDDVDEIVDGLVTLGGRLVFHPAGRELAREFGRMVGSAPRALLTDLYRTRAKLIPYRVGVVLGAPLVSLAMGFLIGFLAPTIGISGLAGRLSEEGGDLAESILKKGFEIGRRFHEDESGSIEVPPTFRRAAHRHMGRGDKLDFDRPPGTPAEPPYDKMLAASALLADSDQPPWGLSRRVWGTGGIHLISADFRRDSVTIEIRGELLDIDKPKGDPPRYNNHYQPDLDRLRNYYGVNDELELRALHLWGPGFGDEAEAGIMLGHKKVNQDLQNFGVEHALRELRKEANEQGYRVMVRATAKSHPVSKTRKQLKRVRQPSGSKHVPETYPIPQKTEVQYSDNHWRGGLFLQEVSYRMRVINQKQETAVGGNFAISLTSDHPDLESTKPPNTGLSFETFGDPQSAGGWAELFRSLLGSNSEGGSN